MSFVDKVLKTGAVPIHYIISKDREGRDCYYIIVCNKVKVDDMLDGNGFIKPEEYGHVVDSGFGKRPPEDVVKMLKEKYNFDIDA
jgi:hypothetical protein